MTNHVTLEHITELRDVSGQPVAYLVPTTEFERLRSMAPPGFSSPSVAELRADWDALRAKLAEVEAERDEYRRAILAWAKEQFSMTPEEVEAAVAESTIPFESVLEELERKHAS